MVTYLQTLLRAWKSFVFVDQWMICEHFSLSHSFFCWIEKLHNTFRGRRLSSWLLDCFLIHRIKLSIRSALSHFTSFMAAKHDGWADRRLSVLNWVYWTLSGRTMDRYEPFAAPKTAFVWCLTSFFEIYTNREFNGSVTFQTSWDGGNKRLGKQLFGYFHRYHGARFNT